MSAAISALSVAASSDWRLRPLSIGWFGHVGDLASDRTPVIAALLADGETIVDVGANIGTHSIAFGSRFPNSEVAAFEPQPLAFGLLSANILAAHWDNVTARKLGCGETGQLMHVAPDYEAVGWNIGGLTKTAPRARGSTPISTTTLR